MRQRLTGFPGAGLLTKDLLCSLYHELNSKYYGEETVIDEDIDHEWGADPTLLHAVLCLPVRDRIFRGDGDRKADPFWGRKDKEGYFRFLKGGCSKTPVELLKLVGLDMEKPDVVNEAMKVFEGLIKELEGSFS